MGQDMAVLILAGARARAACPLTHDKNALRRASTGSARPIPKPGCVRPCSGGVTPGRHPDPRIYLLTDGAFEMEEGRARGLPLGEAQLHFVRIARGR